MSLRIAGHLFTGPFTVDEMVVRKNHDPAVFAVISREGKPWSPIFRLLDVGETGDEGLVFKSHPQRDDWERLSSSESGVLGIYVYSMPRAQFAPQARSDLVQEIRTQYAPPRGEVRISGL